MYLCSQCGNMLLEPCSSGTDDEGGLYADFECNMCWAVSRFYAKDEEKRMAEFEEATKGFRSRLRL